VCYMRKTISLYFVWDDNDTAQIKGSIITKCSLPLHLLSCQKGISASSCNSPCRWHDPLPEETNLSILHTVQMSNTVTFCWSPNLWLNLETSAKAWQRLLFQKKIKTFSTQVYSHCTILLVVTVTAVAH
jgi:hypothetical protein